MRIRAQPSGLWFTTQLWMRGVRVNEFVHMRDDVSAAMMRLSSIPDQFHITSVITSEMRRRGQFSLVRDKGNKESRSHGSDAVPYNLCSFDTEAGNLT